MNFVKGFDQSLFNFLYHSRFSKFISAFLNLDIEVILEIYEKFLEK